jgi:Protein of unknown function (DUF3467)
MPKKPHDGVEKTENASVTFVRSADFTSVYANYARVNFNPFEISVLFGHAAVVPEQQDKVAIEITTRVTMGAVEAKLLIQMLTNIVGGFEKKYGRVAIPEDVRLPVEVTMEGD